MVPVYSLGEVLQGLTGVRPRLARGPAEALLREAGLLGAVREAAYPATEMREGTHGPYLVLFPTAARCLLEGYMAGRLPLARGATPVSPVEWLARFAALTDEDLAAMEAAQPLSFELLEEAYWRWSRRASPHAPRSPEERRWRNETPFVYRGISFTRSRIPLRSNSGKRVVGGWTTFDGSDGSVFRNEGPALNRRNDPDRNWGLGRE